MARPKKPTKKKRGRKKKSPAQWIIPAAILLIAAVLLLSRSSPPTQPYCSMQWTGIPDDIQAGETIHLTLEIENTGADSLCNDKSFAGVHLEFEDAYVGEPSLESSTHHSASDIKREGRIKWFEAKYRCLNHGDTARVSVDVTPSTDQLTVHYRCWIPAPGCDGRSPPGIGSKYRSHYWRNERCLHRNPREGNVCPVRVYAGYPEKQNLTCNTEVFY